MSEPWEGLEEPAIERPTGPSGPKRTAGLGRGKSSGSEAAQIRRLITEATTTDLFKALTRVLPGDEDEPVWAHTPDADLRLANALEALVRKNRAQAEPIIAEIHERYERLMTLRQNAWEMTSKLMVRSVADLPAARLAIGAWAAYLAESPGGKDPDAAAAKAQLERVVEKVTLDDARHRREVRRIVAAGVVVIWLVLIAVSWWMTRQARLCLANQEYRRTQAWYARSRVTPWLTIGVSTWWVRGARTRAAEAAAKAQGWENKLRTAEQALRGGRESDAIGIIHNVLQCGGPDFRDDASRLQLTWNQHVANIKWMDEHCGELARMRKAGEWSGLYASLAKAWDRPRTSLESLRTVCAPIAALRSEDRVEDLRALMAIPGKQLPHPGVALHPKHWGGFIDFTLAVNGLLEKRDEGIDKLLLKHQWASATKLVEELSREPNFVPKETGDRVTGKVREAETDANKILTQMKQFVDERRLHDVVQLFEKLTGGNKGTGIDPESFFQASKDAKALTENAQKRIDELAGPVDEALKAKKYKTATASIQDYERSVADASRPERWRSQIEQAGKDHEADNGPVASLRKALADEAARQAVADMRKQVDESDPERHFASTKGVLEAADERLSTVFPKWEKEWKTAADLLASREYRAAEEAFKKAAEILPKAIGEALFPGEEKPRVFAASEAPAEFRKLKDTLGQLVHNAPLLVLERDPHNWAGHTCDAIQKCLGIHVAYANGDKFEMGRSGEFLDRCLRAGALRDKDDVQGIPKARDVTLAGFYIGIRLVSVEEFCTFLNDRCKEKPKLADDYLVVGEAADVVLQAGQFQPGEGQGSLPVTSVSWDGADAYCRWLEEKFSAGLKNAKCAVGVTCRLPSEAAWEYAASWNAAEQPPKRLWACGNDKAKVPVVNKELLRVDKHNNDISPIGCYHMTVNARQWVNDWYDETRAQKVIRGSSFVKDADGPVGITVRRWQAPKADKLKDVGFRVVLALEVKKQGAEPQPADAGGAK